MSQKCCVTGSLVNYYSPELLFLGHSGQPYRGSVEIEHITYGKVASLVDIKKMITSMRHDVILSEDISYVIHTKLMAMCSYVDLVVKVRLTARGGIQQTICYPNNLLMKLSEHKSKVFQL